MPTRPAEPAPSGRERILESAVSRLMDVGLADQSLRSLAAAIGTNPRMVLYHFGSKEGLWTAVLQAVRDREVERLRPTLDATLASGNAEEAMAAAWRQVSRPRYQRVARLYTQILCQELADPERYDGLSSGAQEDWRAALLPVVRAAGVPSERATDLTRVIMATLLGLQLEVCSTGDRRAASRAAAEFGHMLEVARAALASSNAASRPKTRALRPLDREAQARLDALGGLQSWLRAEVRELDAESGRLELTLRPQGDWTGPDDTWRDDVVRSFAQLGAEAGARLLAGDAPCEHLRVDLLADDPTGPIELRVLRLRARDGWVLDLHLDGDGPIAIGRANVPRTP